MYQNSIQTSSKQLLKYEYECMHGLVFFQKGTPRALFKQEDTCPLGARPHVSSTTSGNDPQCIALALHAAEMA